MCPAYWLTIYDDGTVVYIGHHTVTSLGLHTAQISRREVNQLLNEITRSGFFSLDNEYKSAITDLPTFTVSIRMGVRAKTVVHYGLAPRRLFDLEYKIDEVANSAQWVGTFAYRRPQ
jgi:hypothetical protein